MSKENNIGSKYITEINRFYDWLETNQLPKSAIALWHGLMHINNKAGWERIFTVAISTIESKTGFKRSELFEARNLLTQKGRIKWKQRGGNLCAEYEMQFFSVRIADASTDTSADAKAYTKPTQKHTIKKTTLHNTNSSSAKAASKKKEVDKPEKTKYWQKLVDTWFVFNEKKFKEKPSFAGADPRHLKKIIELLEKRAVEKKIEWTEEKAVEWFEYFLQKAFEDTWLSKNFLLVQLERFIDKILLNQNGQHKPKPASSSKGSTIDDIQALKRGGANKTDNDFNTGGNAGSEIGAEWAEATVVE